MEVTEELQQAMDDLQLSPDEKLLVVRTREALDKVGRDEGCYDLPDDDLDRLAIFAAQVRAGDAGYDLSRRLWT